MDFGVFSMQRHCFEALLFQHSFTRTIVITTDEFVELSSLAFVLRVNKFSDIPTSLAMFSSENSCRDFDSFVRSECPSLFKKCSLHSVRTFEKRVSSTQCRQKVKTQNKTRRSLNQRPTACLPIDRNVPK